MHKCPANTVAKGTKCTNGLPTLLPMAPNAQMDSIASGTKCTNGLPTLLPTEPNAQTACQHDCQRYQLHNSLATLLPTVPNAQPACQHYCQCHQMHKWRTNTIGNCAFEGTFARRAPGAPSIQMNVPAIYHNPLPPNITPSSSPGTLSTCTLYDYWRSIYFPFFRPTNGTITCTLPL